MGFCSNCGTKANENDKFCNECGAKLYKPIKIKENESLLDSDLKNNGFQSIIGEMVIPPVDNDNNFTNEKDNPYNKNYTSNYREKNKSGKKYVLASAFILVLIVAVIFFINKDKIFENVSGKRTIMIYMIGSDLESKYISASTDIEEMINSKADFENINILLYTGGTKEWYNEKIPNDKNALFKVTADGLVLLEEYEESSMGNPDNIEHLLNYSYKNYKAEKYSLIFWDHGGGPIYGYGYDEYHKRDSLTMNELQEALSNSPFGADNKLEFIGFDACLMASVEVAYMISDYADYMIASEETEPGDGWNYNFLGTITKNTTTYELGQNVLDYYRDYYKKTLTGKGITLSLIKLSKIDALEREINNLFKNIDENLLIDYSIISRSRSNSKTFGKNSSSGYDLVDLYDLIENLPSKYDNLKEKVKSAIKDAVVYQTTDLLNTNGISIYFPYENKTDINKLLYEYKTFNFAEEYTLFIDNFASKLTGTRLYNWNLENNIPTAKEEDKIEVTIPNDVKDNYSSASYIIFEKTEDDYYMPVYKGTDVVLDGNKLSTSITKKALVASDSDGVELYVTSLEAERGTEYTKYLIPGTLQRWEGDNFDNFEVEAVYLEFIVDEENQNGNIGGAIPVISEESISQVSPKSTINISDWQLIQLWNYKYKIFDENGKYTNKWNASGVVTGFEAKTSEGFKLEFKDLDASKEYYCLFRIADSQGNVYTTNVVKVNI